MANLDVEAKYLAKSYNVGDEITVKGESFFVLKSTDDTITLITKYALKDDGSLKQSEGCTMYEYFSTTYDSVVDLVSGQENVDYTSINLNDNALLLADETSAIYKANAYAKTIGGSTATGGLLTYEEVTETYKDLEDIIFATYYVKEQNMSTYFWLATSYNENSVRMINYADNQKYYSYGLINEPDNTNWKFCIRPVITIPKSAL